MPAKAANAALAKKFVDFAASPEIQAEGIVKQFNWYPGIDAAARARRSSTPASWNKLFTDISPDDLRTLRPAVPAVGLLHRHRRRLRARRAEVTRSAHPRREASPATTPGARDACAPAGRATCTPRDEARVRPLGRAARSIAPALARHRGVLPRPARPVGRDVAFRKPRAAASRSRTSRSRSSSTPPTCSSRWRSCCCRSALIARRRDRDRRLPDAGREPARTSRCLRWLYRWPLFIPFIVTGQVMRTFLAKNGMLNHVLIGGGLIEPLAAQSLLDWRGIVDRLRVEAGAVRHAAAGRRDGLARPCSTSRRRATSARRAGACCSTSCCRRCAARCWSVSCCRS